MPICVGHHGQLHDLNGNGAFAGWTKPKRRAWEALQVELHQQLYSDVQGGLR